MNTNIQESKVREYRLDLQETLLGRYYVEASSPEEAEKLFWEAFQEIDLGTLMDDTAGIEVVEIKEVQND
jgi:hypothetical protein